VAVVAEISSEAIRTLEELRGVDPERAFLRVFVAGRGCCATRFGLAFEARPDPDDLVQEVDSVPIVVDAMSAPLCDELVIRFVRTDDGEGFVVQDPTSGGGCRCHGAPSAE
jgi:iron-sulfur cluster assembly protein